MHCLKESQKIPLSLEESWKFFSNPKNLQILTPAHMGFEIMNEVREEMYPGQIISYTIHPLWNIPINWVTEITHVQAPHYFIDEQRFGPYAFWHHEHRFVPIAGGIEMLDTIYYKLPLGSIGRAVNALKVKGDLAAIFSYRRVKLEQMFGVYPHGGGSA